MKKMIMFFVAIMVAELVQAGSINWQFYTNENLLGYYVYVLTTVPNEINSLNDIINNSKSSDKIHPPARGNPTASGVIIDASWLDGQTVNYTYFITATVDGKDYYWRSAEQTENAYAPPSPGANITHKELDIAAPGGVGWTQVPEPTAFALLALGVAAFGLRRKIRG